MKISNAPSSVRPFRILLIDDNQNGLMARRTLLEEIGYETCTASSPEDGLAQFAASPFDLVITDYKMPKMNGAQVIASIREKNPAIPIVLISGMVDALGLNETNTGADVVIAKSATEVTHMTRAVNRLLKRSIPKKPAGSQLATRYRAKSV
ncbi:MAG TPA: response regulator [Bryobacteraceae bacterium]|nr:response regulator [Bryobacteraceae bacterium]